MKTKPKSTCTECDARAKIRAIKIEIKADRPVVKTVPYYKRVVA